MDDPISLPARLDTAGAPALVSTLSGRRGKPAVLDGSAVTNAGALGLQVLMAACRQWQSDGQRFEVSAPSEALITACEILGIGAADIGLQQQEA